MSRRKQLLVLSTTVPLLMFGATMGVAAPKDFSICDEVPGTGGAYGLCRAGVAVGCADDDNDTGNAQACANIEEHYLTVMDQSAPWVCPCNFESVPKASPSSSPYPGPWHAPEGSEIICKDHGDEDFTYREVFDSEPNFETVLLAGLYATSLTCSIEEGGNVVVVHTELDEVQTANCVSKLGEYWDDLWALREDIDGAFLDACTYGSEM